MPLLDTAAIVVVWVSPRSASANLIVPLAVSCVDAPVVIAADAVVPLAMTGRSLVPVTVTVTSWVTDFPPFSAIWIAYVRVTTWPAAR